MSGGEFGLELFKGFPATLVDQAQRERETLHLVRFRERREIKAGRERIQGRLRSHEERCVAPHEGVKPFARGAPALVDRHVARFLREHVAPAPVHAAHRVGVGQKFEIGQKAHELLGSLGVPAAVRGIKFEQLSEGERHRAFGHLTRNESLQALGLAKELRNFRERVAATVEVDRLVLEASLLEDAPPPVGERRAQASTLEVERSDARLEVLDVEARQARDEFRRRLLEVPAVAEHRDAQGLDLLREQVLEDRERLRGVARDEHALSLREEVTEQVRDRVGLARSGRPLHEHDVVAFDFAGDGELLGIGGLG